MSLLSRLVTLERGRPREGRPFLCWTITDTQIEAAARGQDVPVADLVRRLAAVHQASERARGFWRVPAGMWYQGPLYTALTAHLMDDEDGGYSFEDAEATCAAVAQAVGPAHWREGYPYR